MKKLIFVVLFGLFCILNLNNFYGEKTDEKGPTIFGLTLGVSTLYDVLKIMGPCPKVSLSSQPTEEEGYKKVPFNSDFIILEYEAEITFSKRHKCKAFILVNPLTYKVTNINIFPNYPGLSDVTKEEITAYYGENPRIVHPPILIDESEIEGLLGDCDEPSGDVEILFYPEKGLEAFLNVKFKDEYGKEINVRFVNTLCFSLDVYDGKKTYPKCNEKK